METKKLLIYATTKQLFESSLANGIVSLDSVAFIEEPREIWAQGNYYPCPYSKEEVSLLFDDFKLNIDALIADCNKMKITKITASSDTVAASYQLLDKDGNPKGVTIDIPKDQSIRDIKVSTLDATLDSNGMIVDGTGTTALCISYILANGTYKIAALDYLRFLEETEFGNGIEIVNHKVQVKIDSTSEPYLTVGTNGVKLSGLKTTVDRVNSIWEGDSDLVTPTINGTWTVYKLDNTVVTPTPSFPLEFGYKAKFSGTWRWYPESGKKNPTSTSGNWGTTLPSAAIPSASFTSDNYVTSNTTYIQTIYAPKSGLMVSGSKVVPAEGEDYKQFGVTISFSNRIYYGVSTEATPTLSIITGLSSKLSGKVNTVTNVTATSSLYYYYAYPKSLGTLSTIIQDGATPVLGAFTRSELTITNSAGLSVPLYVYRTNNPGAFTNNTLKFE